MSSDDNAGFIAEYNSLVLNAYCAVAAATFIFYEYIITFTEEVELFWRRGSSGATFLFLTNRYLVLAINIVSISGFASLSDKSCSLLARAAIALEPLQYIGWAVFSGLRSYALTRNHFISILVFLLSCVPIGADYSFFRFNVDGVNIPVVGCTGTYTMSADVISKFVIGTRTSLIVADLILIYETWSVIGRKGGIPSHRSHSFGSVLLYYGVFYFGVLFVMNVLHLVLTKLAIDTPLDSASNVSAFTEPITATLISRFLLQLHSARKRTLHIDSHSRLGESTSRLETLVFERAVGSIASSLSPEDIDYLEDEHDPEDTHDESLSGTAEDEQHDGYAMIGDKNTVGASLTTTTRELQA
ncbi:hypothetical protein C8Q74DRAFT_1445916 [Fomes fomentarius]|nr:hypothetical protein C8Q74DRAFT_1445916 [Fomes fomentarius]